MRKMIFAALVLAMATPALAMQAGQAPPSAQPDAAALAAARDLLHALNYEQQFEAAARQASEASFVTTLQEVEAGFHADLPDEVEAEIRTIMREHVERMIAEMRPTVLEDAARVYARYFTAAELREVGRLMGHPVMAKMQLVGPQLTTELMQIGVAASARRIPELMAQVQSAIEAWQQRHPARQQPTPAT